MVEDIVFKCIGMCGAFAISLSFGSKMVYEKLSFFLMFVDMFVCCNVWFMCLVMFINLLLKIEIKIVLV